MGYRDGERKGTLCLNYAGAVLTAIAAVAVVGKLGRYATSRSAGNGSRGCGVFLETRNGFEQEKISRRVYRNEGIVRAAGLHRVLAFRLLSPPTPCSVLSSASPPRRYEVDSGRKVES